jgi:hypothetical protein
MHWNSPAIRLLTLCLVLLLLGAQFHFCGDFASANSSSHVCQVCATAGHAVIVQALLTELTPAVCRLEVSCAQLTAPSLSFSATSPRAPPSL